ncbi:MAG: c-type cytochrome [Chloroflexota bacterium]|nr:c-type cytochrome [Lentimicrobium sp.]
MKSIFTMLAILSALFTLSYCTSKNDSEKKDNQISDQKTEMSNSDLVAKGEYLVTIMGCNDCHSPKQMGPNGPEIIKETMLSGYPANRPVMEPDKGALKKGWGLMTLDLTQSAGPWGVSFSANLTPDPTGIGNWSEEQFKTAITKGKFKGMENGRTLLPPMPWQNFTKLKDEDVKAIFAYLKSIKPVSNVVPAPIPPDQIK